MIEYSRDESNRDVNDEGDYIQNVIDRMRVDPNHVRIGVVVFHDTVTESVHIDEYRNDKEGLKNKIEQLTRYCRYGRDSSRCRGELTSSGEPDFAKALDFARENSFKGARPGVPKIVVPILHSVRDSQSSRIREAAQRLKDDCIQLTALVVKDRDSHINEDLIRSIVSEPSSTHYLRFYSFGSSYFGGFGSLESSANLLRCY